jgi:DNA-binding transcriptional MerR regulator
VAVMEGESDRYRIGELARLSGLTVKTIRFYSDRGLVPPAARTGAGYRVYDERALARLELIRALRELGASLADVERVLSRELDVRELVALQLEAVEAQLRVLRVRRAVLMAVASGEPDGQELRTMTRLAHISDDERKRIVEDFLDEVLGGLEVDPGLEARLRGGLPELPDEPTPDQVEAWVELAELVRDPDFRARIRQMAESGHERLGLRDPRIRVGRTPLEDRLLAWPHHRRDGRRLRLRPRKQVKEREPRRNQPQDQPSGRDHAAAARPPRQAQRRPDQEQRRQQRRRAEVDTGGVEEGRRARDIGLGTAAHVRRARRDENRGGAQHDRPAGLEGGPDQGEQRSAQQHPPALPERPVVVARHEPEGPDA